MANQQELKIRRAMRWWSLFVGATAGVCLVWLGSIGEKSADARLLGYSDSRLLMMGILLAGLIFAAVIFVFSCHDTPGKFARLLCKRWVRFLGWTLFYLCAGLLLSGRFLLAESFRPFYERLCPLLSFLGLFALASLLLSAWIHNGCRASAVPRFREILRLTLGFLAAAVLIYLTIRFTRIGIDPDEMDWQPTGMTIQYWEIWLSLLTALLLSQILYALPKLPRPLIDVLSFFGIWAGCAVLWVSIPTMEALNHSYFMEITAPNYLPYPASDCANFGLWVESILAGMGFKTTIAYRQFLIVVIAFFETITRHDILKTIDCLTILLALLPAVMYLLGTRLHSRGAGYLAAGMVMLREYNTILLAPHFMVSSAKMWLSDLPAMLCLLAALTVCVSWFQKPRSVWRVVLTGCLFGLCVTIRSQILALIPFPAFFFLLRKELPGRKKILGALIFLISALIVVAPWFMRSKLLTGDFILDDPGVHSTELARRYSDDVTNQVTRLPDESDAEYARRNEQHMLDFFLEKPGYVVHFIMSHFTANEIYSLCVLPFGTDAGLTVRDVTNTDYLDVEGRLLDNRNLPLLFLFVALIVIGMEACWKRAGCAGLLPFLMCSLYLGSSAAARYSGWRFALPGDWFYYFYFAVGVFEVIYWIAVRLGADPHRFLSVPVLQKKAQPARFGLTALLLAVFLVLGAAPAFMDTLIPDQIVPQSHEENLNILREYAEQYGGEFEQLGELAEDPERMVINGRDLYPRYFGVNEGLSSGHPWPSYDIRDFSRLGFVLLNRENYNVVVPLSEEPAFVPHAADVIVVGAFDERGFFRGDAVVFLKKDEQTVPRIIWADQIP